MKVLTALWMVCCFSVYGQVEVGKPKLVSTQALSAFGVPTQKFENWDVSLVNYTSFDHISSVTREEFNRLKAEVNSKRGQTSQTQSPSIINRNEALSPVMGVNFQGNIQGNNVPPDNAMAVSNNGYIVSAINSNIIFANSKGDLEFTQNLSDFFSFTGINSGVYDPRILFDVEHRRFIVISLHGNTPETSKILVAFSKYEDPSAGWYYYSFDGNPLGDEHWFDYPNVGLTDNNLFFTGLMRDDNGLWQYSVIYQIDKRLCFEGKQTNWSYYSDVNNADGEKAFNLVPTHTAWNNYPDSKMYFISNVANGGDQYHLHSIDGNVGSELPIIAYQITGPQTELAPDGKQPNTINEMNTFDSRIWGAMELNGIIHFGAHVNSPENTSGIFYGRFNIADKTVKGHLYYDKDFDYGFPSIAAIGHSITSDTVLINMLKTGKTLFPSQVAVICSGQGDEFTFSKEVTTKTGTGFVNVLTENRERWGDYTTVGRRFYQETPEVWITGCYGRGTYGTWLAQYFSDSTQNIVDFIADKTTLNPGETTKFSLLPNTNYTLVEWVLNNGTETITSVASPSLSYPSLGSYDITVKVQDNLGNIRSVKKEKFITVIAKVLAPVANFTVDRDTIYQGESVQFMDLSTNEPLSFTWTFTNGLPSSSTLQNPVVRYEKIGSFLVNLSVKNTAGSDNEIKQKYITVLQAKLPEADFGSSVTEALPGDAILFFDNSTNVPTSWQWQFPGGTPQTSEDANPIITYEQNGQYNVTLIAKNFAGSDTIVKEKYIQIGETSTDEVSDDVIFKLYPNPVLSEKITIDFELKKSSHFDIKLYDSKGQFIKSLISQKIKAGLNQLIFSPASLHSGTYFISIESKSSTWKKTLRFEKI